jgi:ubiquinone/menaquinone biosynthesis C-methylase UbiE
MSLKLSIYKNWENSRNNAILSLLEVNPKAKVIDLGCGSGEFTLKVKEKIKSNEIIGVDIHDEALDKSKERGIIAKNQI